MSEVQGTKKYIHLSVPTGIKVQIGTTPFRVYLLYLPQHRGETLSGSLRARPPLPPSTRWGGVGKQRPEGLPHHFKK